MADSPSSAPREKRERPAEQEAEREMDESAMGERKEGKQQQPMRKHPQAPVIVRCFSRVYSILTRPPPPNRLCRLRLHLGSRPASTSRRESGEMRQGSARKSGWGRDENGTWGRQLVRIVPVMATLVLLDNRRLFLALSLPSSTFFCSCSIYSRAPFSSDALLTLIPQAHTVLRTSH